MLRTVILVLFIIFSTINSFDVNLKEISSNGSFNFDYKFIHKPQCSHKNNLKSSLKLTFIVKVRVDNFKRRKTIRKIWGFENQLLPNVSLRTIFNTGLSKSKLINKHIRNEFHTFQDILQSNYLDSYRNNTLKSIMGINWAAEYCKSTDFFLMVDDDMLVSVKNLVKALKDENYTRSNLLYMGYTMEESESIRDMDDIHYVPESQYPYKFYPTYVSGGAIIFSQLSMQIIKKAIPKIKMFSVDDAFIGVVANAFRIPAIYHTEIKMFDTIDMQNWSLHTETIASHFLDSFNNVVKIWNILHTFGFA